MWKLPRFGIFDVILLTSGVAVLLFSLNEFGEWYEHEMMFATFLGLMVVASLVAWVKLTPAQAFFWGFALFCWLYLAVALRFGFVDDLRGKCDVGVAFSYMTGVASRWLFVLTNSTAAEPANPIAATAANADRDAKFDDVK